MGNPGGANSLIPHLSPRGILSFVGLQDAGGPLPCFWQPFSFKPCKSWYWTFFQSEGRGKELCSPVGCGALLSILPVCAFTVVSTREWAGRGCCMGGNPAPPVLPGRRAGLAHWLWHGQRSSLGSLLSCEEISDNGKCRTLNSGVITVRRRTGKYICSCAGVWKRGHRAELTSGLRSKRCFIDFATSHFYLSFTLTPPLHCPFGSVFNPWMHLHTHWSPALMT